MSTTQLPNGPVTDYNSVQYLRACSILVLSTGNGQPIELADMHVKFQIEHAIVGTPQFATIRIYNLADATVSQIQNEYTIIQIQAGYPGNIGLIFIGDIRQFRVGRENATDKYLDICAADGDKAHNYAIINTTIRSIGGTGATQQSQFNAAMVAMGRMGVTAGFSPTFAGTSLPRAKACYGMAKDYLHDLANVSGCSWAINQGQVNMVPLGSALPGAPIAINAGSGMIGSAKQTLGGIEVRCLINPLIKFHGLIQINNALVQQLQLDPSVQGAVTGNDYFIDYNTGINYGLSTDGIYQVYAINFLGDTRGQEWYQDIICCDNSASGRAPNPVYPIATISLPSSSGN